MERAHIIRTPHSRAAGQAVLSLVLLIGTILIVIALTLVFVSTSFTNIAYGVRAANKAQAAAFSGVYDALLRLDRNKAFSSSGYSVTSGDTTASISVTQGSPTAGEATILSTATVLGRQRQVQMIVSVNATSGLVSFVSAQLQ